VAEDGEVARHLRLRLTEDFAEITDADLLLFEEQIQEPETDRTR